jgi:hypothetical protein
MRAAVLLTTTVLAAALLGAASSAAQGRSGSPVDRTHRVVVRPIDASGHARPAYSVTRFRGVKVTCDESATSAVDDGIYTCYPAAEYLPACWKAHHHTVLCLRDARTTRLARFRWTGTLGTATAPKRPSPIDLDLAGGQKCSIRVGGAWGILPTHPNWVGFYSCDRGSIYGPASGDGVDRSTSPWTVHLWKSGTKHRVVTRDVATAYFVGTHR